MGVIPGWRVETLHHVWQGLQNMRLLRLYTWSRWIFSPRGPRCVGIPTQEKNSEKLVEKSSLHQLIWSDPYPDCWPIVVSESYINNFFTYPPWTNVAPEESMQRRLFFLRMAYFQVPILLISRKYCILSLYPKCWHLVVSKACIKKSLIFALTTHVFFLRKERRTIQPTHSPGRLQANTWHDAMEQN